MKHQIAVFALICSTLVVPASAAVDDCVYGGSQMTQANNGDVLTISSQNHVCIITPLPASGIPGAANFPTGITTGIPGTNGPFATVSSSGGPVRFTTATTSVLGIQGRDLLITDNNNGPILALDKTSDLGVFALISDHASFASDVSAGGHITLGTASTDGQGLVVDGSACNFSMFTQAGTGFLQCGTTSYLVFDPAGGISVNGTIATLSVGNAGANGLVASNTLINGVGVANTYHCVVSGTAGVTASGASTAVDIGSSGQFFLSAHYSLTINDDTVLSTVPVVTAKALNGFTFSSVNTHVYSYQACGE